MAKKVWLIYQDCFNCEEKAQWFEEQINIAKKNRLRIDPKPHHIAGIKDIILKAREVGLESTLLFYTDGERFGYDIREFIKPTKSVKKAQSKER